MCIQDSAEEVNEFNNLKTNHVDMDGHDQINFWISSWTDP